VRKLLQNAAFIIIALGFLAIIGWLARNFFTAAEISLWVRVVVGVVGAAFVLLFGIVLKDRIVQAKKESFREVDK